MYFLTGDGDETQPRLVQIAATTDIHQRFQTLRAENAYPVSILGIIVDERADVLEATLHQRFVEYHDHGKWFAADNELMAYIAANARPVDGQRVASGPHVNLDFDVQLDGLTWPECEPEALLTLGQMASDLNVSVPTMLRVLRSERLPHFRIGKQIRFVREEVYAHLRKSHGMVSARPVS